jgi:bacterioferritin-associated ferredoxin
MGSKKATQTVEEARLMEAEQELAEVIRDAVDTLVALGRPLAVLSAAGYCANAARRLVAGEEN